MRKILLILIIILLLVLGYICLAKGIEISTFPILSLEEIEQTSQNLKTKIEEVNTLIDVEYPRKISELKTSSNKMESAKEEYLKLTNLSSEEQILNARTEKSYAIEFLWAKIGTHARKEGINLKLEIASSSTGANNVNDLKFTVDGSYIAITNFIYAIENDSELDFRIQNFKLLPYQDDILQGTFTVRNIAIKGNTSTQNVTNKKEDTNSDNSQNNTQRTNTTTSEQSPNETENTNSNVTQ